MKKIFVLLILSLTFISTNAQEKKKPISVDLSYGISLGVYDSDGSIEGEVKKWVSVFLSLRAGPLVNVSYNFTDKFALGLETGIETFAFTSSSTNSEDSTNTDTEENKFSVKFRDIPLRLTTTFTPRQFFIRPYLGGVIHYSSGDLEEEYKGTSLGWEIGARGGIEAKLWKLRYVPYGDFRVALGKHSGMRIGLGLLVHLYN